MKKGSRIFFVLFVKKNKSNESFIYFENISSSEDKLEFKAYSPLKSDENCFMLIKSKDIDNDGDLDILLGSNSRIFTGKTRKGSLNSNWQKDGGIITILRNTSK